MRSSGKVVRLPAPARPWTVSRAVEPFRFDDERASADGAPPGRPAPSDRQGRIATARADGYREGFAAGLARGREEGEAPSRDAVAILRKAAARLADERAAVVAGAEKDLADLAIAIAARVIRREAAVDRDLVVRVVRDALHRVTPLEEIVVRLHPADAKMVRETPTALEALREVRHFEIVGDRRVGRGGCLVEAGAGAIDARLETALEEIERALHRATEGPRGDSPAV
jgi:flagellar assembly protein FliH